MTVTVARIGGRLVPQFPGASRMDLEFDPYTALLTMSCPFCGKQTLRYLAEGDSFEVNHRRSCRLDRAVRRLMEEHPELVGKGTELIIVGRGD